jgi:Zn-dependent protease with chaperone function
MDTACNKAEFACSSPVTYHRLNMNFFEHQHLARRNARRLVLLFALALLALIVVTNVLLAIAWRATVGMGGLPGYFYVANTFVILLLVLGGAWFETWNLRDGGDAVAQMVGGRLVTGNPRDARDKRLTNIVEEMALAAGIAVPKVYVLDREEGINAFAAGTGPNDSVVAVTRGTLERLSRDELQGVVAHEFSHIVNGDVQLNLRLTGLVFGLTLLSHLGELALHGARGSRDEKGGLVFLAVVGLVLLIMGWIGAFFGRLITAGVSREREFLADASAVQFTRNQDGIGGALRKIAGFSVDGDVGSALRSVHANTVAHMFMAGVRHKFIDGWLATHPPLQQRIQRIYGSAREALKSVPEPLPVAEPAPTLPPLHYAPVGLVNAAAMAASAGTTQTPPPMQDARQTAQQALLAACADSFGAQAATLAWLLAEDASTRAAQCMQLPAGITARSVAQLAQHTAAAGQAFRLITFNAATPHLKLLSAKQRQAFLLSVDHFVAADQRVLPFEFALQTLLAARLAPPHIAPVMYRKLEELQPHLRTTLAVFAKLPGREPQTEAPLDYTQIRSALTEVNKLAPLAKPQVIKLWAGLRDGSAVADELAQAMSAAIDCPWPVAAPELASVASAH